MREDDQLGSLQELEARLNKLRSAVEPRPPSSTAQSASGLGMAFTISSHLVAGLLVGGFVGYWLDDWLGTSPWMLIVFFFLGAAAGMLNTYRSVKGMGMAAGYRPAPAPVDPDVRAAPVAASSGTGANGEEGPRGKSA